MSKAAVNSTHIRIIYDRLAPGYDRRRALLEWLLWRHYRRQLLSWAHGKVLEIGIGTGRNLPYYPPDCQITGVDISPEMIQIAEQRAARLGLSVTLLPLDAHELPFPDGSFDTVVSSLTLCTLIDPVRALSEMSRVTATNGRVLLLEHGRSCYGLVSSLVDRFARPYMIRRCGCHPNRNIVALVQAADLVVLRVDRYALGMIQLVRARPPRSTRMFR